MEEEKDLDIPASEPTPEQIEAVEEEVQETPEE